MNATGFDASTIEEEREPLEWPRSGGVGLISSLGVYRVAKIAYSITQTRERLAAAVGGLYSQPFDPWQLICPLVRELERLNQELERWRPFWEEMGVALDAYFEGNEDDFWEWVEMYTGCKPNALFRTSLKHKMPGAQGDVPAHPFLHFLKVRAARMRAGVERSPARRTEVMRLDKRLYKFGELRQALAPYTKDEELTEMHRAVFEAERSLAPGETLTLGMIEWRLKYDKTALGAKRSLMG